MPNVQRYTTTRHTLGSDCGIMVIAAADEPATLAMDAVWERIAAFDAQFSRFRPDSELAALNAAAGRAMTVSDTFLEFLEACQYYNRCTQGIFNPLVLPALQRAGYKGSWPQTDVVDAAVDYSDRQLASFDSMTIRGNEVTLPANSAFDSGGIGKGYALDIAADVLALHGIEGFWINFGGDIICQGGDEAGKPWHIGITSIDSTKRAAGIMTNDTKGRLAIASSTVLKRRGAGWNHLIDPRTGQPTAGDVLMSTVVAASGVAADIFAKFFLINPGGSVTSDDPADRIDAVLLQRQNGTELRQTHGYITETKS